MRLRRRVVATLVVLAASAHAQGTGDTYTCPRVAMDAKPAVRATGIDVYSGHPSEKGHLRPDNDDNDDGPDFWILGSPKFEYWYVCQYGNRGVQREFKLDRAYKRCTAVRAGEYFDKLVCAD